MCLTQRAKEKKKKIVEREKENKIFHGNQAVNGVDFFFNFGELRNLGSI